MTERNTVGAPTNSIAARIKGPSFEGPYFAADHPEKQTTTAIASGLEALYLAYAARANNMPWQTQDAALLTIELQPHDKGVSLALGAASEGRFHQHAYAVQDIYALLTGKDRTEMAWPLKFESLHHLNAQVAALVEVLKPSTKTSPRINNGVTEHARVNAATGAGLREIKPS